jgi:hypothetical protein
MMTSARTMKNAADPTLRWVYLALVVIGSIGAHLASEFGAMGSDADQITFSPRHIYLGIAALAALIFAAREILALRSVSDNARDFKRRIEMGIATLPFAGKHRFGPATAGLFLLIGGATEIGEGCPLCGHDVAAGIGIAVIGSVVLAALVRLFTRRLPSIASAVVEYVAAVTEPEAPPDLALTFDVAPLHEFLWFAQLFNRPPPVPAASR